MIYDEHKNVLNTKLFFSPEVSTFFYPITFQYIQ
jgi:hypothetical protein